MQVVIGRNRQGSEIVQGDSDKILGVEGVIQNHIPLIDGTEYCSDDQLSLQGLSFSKDIFHIWWPMLRGESISFSASPTNVVHIFGYKTFCGGHFFYICVFKRYGSRATFSTIVAHRIGKISVVFL